MFFSPSRPTTLTGFPLPPPLQQCWQTPRPLQTTPCPTYVHKAHSGCCMNVDIVLVVILWWGHFLYRFGGPEQFRHVRPQSSVKDNISKVKSEIQGVVNVMQNNISKVLDRGAKLEDLQDKSGMNGGDHYELAVCVNTTHSNLDHSWCLPFLLWAEDLELNATQFRSGSRRLQRKFWWQNCRVSISVLQNGCLCLR